MPAPPGASEAVDASQVFDAAGNQSPDEQLGSAVSSVM